MVDMIENECVFDADTSGFKIIATVFIVFVLIPLMFVMVFIENSVVGGGGVLLLMAPCVSLLFSEERLYVYKDRMIVTSRYFLYKKIRKYDVKDYKSIKCKFGGQFNGVGSTTTKSLSISLVCRGLDEFNKGELSLSSFFLWNIRDLNANNKNEIISKWLMY